MLNALRLKLFETLREYSAKLEERSKWLINSTSIDCSIMRNMSCPNLFDSSLFWVWWWKILYFEMYCNDGGFCHFRPFVRFIGSFVVKSGERKGCQMLPLLKTKRFWVNAPPPPHPHGKHTSLTHLLSLLLYLSSDCEMINSREL